MLSQYLGKKDETRVRRIFTMACAVSEGVCALFALAAVFASRGVMRLLTNDPVLMEAGSEYLRIAGVSYLFMGISQIDLVLLKARKESHRSMAIGVMTLALNLALNAVFIFGVLGCAVMLAAEGAVTPLFHLTGDAPGYLRVAYRMLSVNTIFASITYTMLCGVFPAGGDTRYGLVLDGTVMWSLVALGAMAAFVLRLHPLLVFVVLNVDELTKTPLVLLRYRKGTWLRNITRSREA